jgi:hypothetical protein
MTAGIDEQSASYSVQQKSDHRVRHNDMAIHQNITDPAAVSQQYLFEDETE